MLREELHFPHRPTPPPNYPVPEIPERMRPQHTGSSKTVYEHELNDIQRGRHTHPQDYDEAYQRWRRGIENDMPHRPPEKSKASNIFATCCCGSVWGVVAWVMGIILIVCAFTTLLVKTILPHANQSNITNPSISIITLTPPPPSATRTPDTSSPSMSTTTITTSSMEPSTSISISTSTSTETTTFVSVSVSTYTLPTPTLSTIFITISSPTPQVLTSIGTVTSTAISTSTAVSTLTYMMKSSAALETRSTTATETVRVTMTGTNRGTNTNF